jgi:hypothetical protein
MSREFGDTAGPPKWNRRNMRNMRGAGNPDEKRSFWERKMKNACEKFYYEIENEVTWM